MNTFNSMKSKRYSQDAFLGQTTSFDKSVSNEVLFLHAVRCSAMSCCFFACCVLDNKKRVGYRAGISVDVLLVPPFASLTSAKFIRLCEHCLVLFSAMYIYDFRISCPYILQHGRAT